MKTELTNYRPSWMTDELDALADMCRAFYEKELLPNRERYEQNHQVDRELWLKAGEAGLLGASIPVEHGGGGGDFSHDAVILGTQSRLGDRAFGNAVHSGIVLHYVSAYGTDELRDRVMAKGVSGEMVGAIAMTEPGTGSNLQGIRTKAVRDGDTYVISGAKTFITNGVLADFVIVAAQTGDPDGGDADSGGLSLIVVETRNDDGSFVDGYAVGRNLEKLGQHGNDTAELFFDEVRVPAENLLGQEHKGFMMLLEQLPRERLIIGVGCARSMEFVVDHTVDYVKDREVFGQPLAKLQNTKFELAACAADTHMVNVFADTCIEQFLAGTLTGAAASMLKLRASELLGEVTDRCLQLHGGYGYMTEYPVARAWADARIDRIYGGANEIMKVLIAQGLLR